MNVEDCKKWIVDHIDVSRTIVVLAKSFVIKNNKICSGDELLSEFLEKNEANKPIDVVIHPSVDTEAYLRKAAKSISYELAFCQAVWELIGSGHIIPGGNLNIRNVSSIQWTTIVRGSGGHRSSWQFNDYLISIPEKLIPAQLQHSKPMPLTDGDLYLKEINVNNLHPDIEISILEAIRCFKYDLYLASLTMLGKAVEGVWLELGFALSDLITNSGKREKIRSDLRNPRYGIVKKMELIIKLYSSQEMEWLWQSSGIRPKDLKQVEMWSNSVRESRNDIHFGAEPPMRNTYDKVAALIIGAVPNIKTIYKIINGATTRR